MPIPFNLDNINPGTILKQKFLINKNLKLQDIKFGNSLSIRKFSTSPCLYSGNPSSVQLRIDQDKLDLLEARFNLLRPVPRNIPEGSTIETPTPTDTPIITPNETATSETILEFKDFPVEDDSPSDFSWLYKDGKPLYFNKHVKGFEAVEYIGHLLEKRFSGDISNLPEAKLTEMLQITKEETPVTVLQLFNHVSKLYNKEDFVLDFTKNIVQPEATQLESGVSSKPLGQFGDMSLNELLNKIKDLNWEVVSGGIKATVHTAPVVLNLISYTLVLRSYTKYIHNQPEPRGLTREQLKMFRANKHHRLLVFSTIWAPLIVLGIRNLSPGIFGNILDVEINPNTSESKPKLEGVNTSSFLLFCSKVRDGLINTIPIKLRPILKWGIRIFLIIILILFNPQFIISIIKIF